MEDVAIIFTPWKKWLNRKSFEDANDQGVYLLAHFKENEIPVGAASPLDPNIIYIGDTRKQTLAIRWSQFNRAAQNGAAGHAGGRTYYKRFGPLKKELCVAFFSPPSMSSERIRSFYIRYVESKLIWKYSQMHKPDKLCNKS